MPGNPVSPGAPLAPSFPGSPTSPCSPFVPWGDRKKSLCWWTQSNGFVQLVKLHLDLRLEQEVYTLPAPAIQAGLVVLVPLGFPEINHNMFISFFILQFLQLKSRREKTQKITNWHNDFIFIVSSLPRNTLKNEEFTTIVSGRQDSHGRWINPIGTKGIQAKRRKTESRIVQAVLVDQVVHLFQDFHLLPGSPVKEIVSRLSHMYLVKCTIQYPEKCFDQNLYLP